MSNIAINSTTSGQKMPFGVIIQSLLVGLFMDIKCINRVLGTFGFEEDSSIMTLLYIASIGAIFAMGCKNHTISRPDKASVFILLYVAISYFFTVVFGGVPHVSLPHLFVFTVAAFLIPFISVIDARITLRAIMFYPVLGITRMSQIFVFVADWNEWISMGLSYAFYVPIVATIIYIALFFKSESKVNKVITLILAIVNVVYLFMIFQFGSRGPITLLLLLILFLFVVRPSEYGIRVNKRQLLIGIFLALFTLIFFEQFLLSVDGYLSQMGISSHVVTKYLNLSGAGDVDHGRNEIMSLALNGFFDSPIWGNGLDCFEQNTGEIYPHNFMLQILYDGGLFFFLLLFIPLFKGCKWYFYNCTIHQYGLFLFLMFAGAAGGLFSGDLWRQPLLWMFFANCLTNKFVIRYE